jgi:hypothetical protein
MSKWSDVAAGKQPCSFCRKMWKLSEIREVDTGSRVRVTVCQECVAKGHDITQWPHDPYFDDQNPEAEISDSEDFAHLTYEEAFQRIAVEVPQLLALRYAIGPEPSPISTDLPFGQSVRQRRNLRKGPDRLRQQEWQRSVWQVLTELKRLVGPDASQGSGLVRSEIALFKCAQVLVPSRLAPPGPEPSSFTG